MSSVQWDIWCSERGDMITCSPSSRSPRPPVVVSTFDGVGWDANDCYSVLKGVRIGATCGSNIYSSFRKFIGWNFNSALDYVMHCWPYHCHQFSLVNVPTNRTTMDDAIP
jgi:hypothetical protein